MTMPPARLRQILDGAGIAAIISDAASRDVLEAGTHRVLEAEALLARSDHPDAALPTVSDADSAYVIFTSGSTGLPKGAMVVQRGMLNHLDAKIRDLGLTAADAVAQTASQCFDISVWQLLAALAVGGRVHIYPDEVAHDPTKLLAAVTTALLRSNLQN